MRVALDPTPRQERMLEGHAGAARVAYNLMLAHIHSQLARNETADLRLQRAFDQPRFHARQTVPVLHYNRAHGRVGQQTV